MGTAGAAFLFKERHKVDPVRSRGHGLQIDHFNTLIKQNY